MPVFQRPLPYSTCVPLSGMAYGIVYTALIYSVNQLTGANETPSSRGNTPVGDPGSSDSIPPANLFEGG